MDPSLVRELEGIVGKRGLVTGRVRLLPYESDAMALLSQPAELVVLPANTGEAAQVMRVLHREGLPVVPRGAGTGLTGGAMPVAGGVVVGTARMQRLLELNPADRYARVEAGLVNVEITRRCAEHDLFYAPDPSSQTVCTIGGNVANNAGGPHCFKYGSTTRHVLGLVLVTAEGEVLDLSEPLLDPVGYDLVGLLVGSEGTFGLITEVTLRLVPQPPVIETFLAVFPSLDAACDTVSEIIAAGLQPSALEILDKLTIAAVEDSVFAAGYPRDAEAVLLVEAEGSEVEVDVTSRGVRAIAEGQGALELRSARSAAERAQLWAGRKGAFGAMGRVAPDLYVADAVVPRTKLRELVARASEICRERDLRLANVFHAGDGNLHPNICYDRRDEDETRRVVEASNLILQTCVAAGGSLTGEHGIGVEKLEALRYLFGEEDLRAFARVRAVWDPDLRLNPGKTLPERTCAELRGPRAAGARG